MKSINSIMAALFLFPLASMAASGVGVGNGGDLVQCEPSTQNNYSGLYSLDFLVTNEFADGLHIVEVKNTKKFLIELSLIFAEKLPELQMSFNHFNKHLFNEDEMEAPFYWEAASYGLIDLEDENLLSLLPPNCRKDKSTSLIQAIIRQLPSYSGKHPDQIVFRYDRPLIEKLQKEAPLQLSFLVIHEWLWSHSTNVVRNRRLNRFLHSVEFREWDRENILYHIENLGLFLPGIPNAIVNDSICPALPSQMSRLKFKLEQEGDTDPVHFFDVEVLERDQHCNASMGCSPEWLTTTNVFNIFKNFAFAFSRDTETKNNLLLTVKTTDDRVTNALHCSIDYSTAKIACLSPLSLDGQPVAVNGTEFYFTGTINEECVRLTAKTKVPKYGDQSGSKFYFSEKYIFLKIPPIK